MEHTLEVYAEEELIFFSDKKWLHPLFELEEFLSDSSHDPAQLIVKDKIVGRAAALLIIHFGIGKLIAGILSQPGKHALEESGIEFEYLTLVDLIQCRTEKMLQHENDTKKAYTLIRKLAKAATDS